MPNENFEGMSGEEAMNAVLDPDYQEQEGAEEQEVTDPAADDQKPEDKPEDEKDPEQKEDPAAADDKGQQAAEKDNPKNETNAAFAAARRKAEAEAAQRIEAAKREMEDTIKALGLKLPDGRTVSNQAELREYQTAAQQQKFEAATRRAGLTDDEMKELINQHPDVIEAKEAKAQLEKEREKEQQLALKAQLDKDIAEITKINPSIKTFEDIRKLDKYPGIYERVKRGDSVSDAYYLEYREEITNAQVRSAEQQYRSSVSSKSHQIRSDRGAATGREPTRDEMEMMRQMIPGKTDAEYLKSWHELNG